MTHLMFFSGVTNALSLQEKKTKMFPAQLEFSEAARASSLLTPSLFATSAKKLLSLFSRSRFPSANKKTSRSNSTISPVETSMQPREKSHGHSACPQAKQ